MATIQVTNRKESQALRGEAVVVTLDATDSENLSSLSEGLACVNDTSNAAGTISRVDYFGSSFRISPDMPSENFATESGYLADDETITITL